MIRLLLLPIVESPELGLCLVSEMAGMEIEEGEIGGKVRVFAEGEERERERERERGVSGVFCFK